MSMRFRTKVGIGIGVVVLLAAVGLVYCYTSMPTNPRITRGASNRGVSVLLTMTPNLKGFDIESCEFVAVVESTMTMETWWGKTRTTYVLIGNEGFAALSDDGLAALKTGFDWTPAKREEIPQALRALLPGDGEILVSPKFNESFEQSPMYPHGFAAILADDKSNRLYFIAYNKDHPIEMK